MKKQYVSVTAKFDPDGNVIPLRINWDDGRNFDIEQITDVRFAASVKTGGSGIRYTIRIKTHERYLFLEENRWFIENNQAS